MTTLAARGTGTPATTGTTWATVTNAVDGAAGTNPATYATMTNAVASAVATIEVTGYGFSSSIASTDTLNSVTVNLRHFENNTGRFVSVVMQPFDGATAIGTAFSCTLATGARNDSTTFPVTLAQIRSSTFKVRVTITGAASTQSRVESIDYVDVTADYTIVPPAITQASYRWYDEGTETAAVALAAQDTAATGDVTINDGIGQLRVRLQSTTAIAVPAADDWQLQWEKNASGTWSSVFAALVAGWDETHANSEVSFAAASPTNYGVGQSFTGNGMPLRQAGFYLYKFNAPTGTLTAYLYAHTGTFGAGGTPTGAALATSTTTINCSTLTSSSAWYDFDFDGTFTLVSGTNYFIVVQGTYNTSVDLVRARVQLVSGTTGNDATVSGASVWSGASNDMIFRVLTNTPTTVLPYDSANLTDAAATTNRLGAGTGTFVAGKISETGVVTDLGWTANNYTELLYSLDIVNTDVANGDTLRFRVLRNGATTGMTFTSVPTLNMVKTGGAAVALAGTSDGTSTVTAAAIVDRALSASSVGLSSTTAATAIARALAGSADGISTTTAALTVAKAPIALAGTSDGSSATTAAMARAVPFAATSDGTSTTTAAAAVARALAATSPGTSTTTGTLAGVTAHALAGSITGLSTTTGALTVARALAATSTGTSTTVAAVAVGETLTSTSTGTSTTTGAIIVARALAGTSAGVGGADGSFGGAIRALAGTSTGTATTTGTIIEARALTAGSSGIAATAAVISVLTGLSAIAAGLAATTATMTVTAGAASMKVWNGVAYVTGAVKTWNGASYVAATRVKVWNGTTFVDTI